jgi:hypothetical protein
MGNESETGQVGHSHMRSGDPSDFVVGHVADLQYLKDRVLFHDTRLAAHDILFASLNKMSSNLTAVKWVVIGCAIMLMFNEFGFVTTVKLLFK